MPAQTSSERALISRSAPTNRGPTPRTATGHIGGTRNGQEWPAQGSEELLPVLEAYDLVRSGTVAHVETVDDPETVVVMS